MSTGMSKQTKLEKLVSTYEFFGNAVSLIPDEWAEKLSKMSKSVPAMYSSVTSGECKINRSEMASGLEQGLLELPHLIAMISPQWRAQVSKSYRQAIQEKYPEFLAKDEQKLIKIRERGRIKTESEYYLVKHVVDLHEGNSMSTKLLHELFLLIDTYDSKG
jgi:hypothetical protein